MTQFEDQARKMARRVSRIYGGAPIVNVYEIQEDFLSLPDFVVRDFGNDPTPEWARFVLNNRNRKFTDINNPECNLDCKYDIVSGPIANDDMVLLFRQYENKLISFEVLREGLVFREATNQISFHTEKALKLLNKDGVL